MSDALEALRGGLVVSAQAPAGSPLAEPGILAALARAAELGGAAGIRAVEVAAVRAAVRLPVIGLRKRRVEGSDVYITPSLADAVAVAEEGADIVAVDATLRPGAVDLAAAVAELPVPVLADVDSLEAGLAAREAGAAAVATTLSGYTGAAAPAFGAPGAPASAGDPALGTPGAPGAPGAPGSAGGPALGTPGAPGAPGSAGGPALGTPGAPGSAGDPALGTPGAPGAPGSAGGPAFGAPGGSAPHGPDLELVAALAAALDCPVLAEGRVATPEQARAAFDAGAFAVVVGTAITDAVSLTKGFAAAARGVHAAR